MQVHDEKKRSRILAEAARMFATQPFHKVLLSQVAEAAGVGKGTLYTYFDSKEELYLSVIHTGFADLVDRLRVQIDEELHSPLENMTAVVRELVEFACRAPHHSEIMRTASVRHGHNCVRWDNERLELKRLIASVIRSGVSRGIFEDPHPEITARFITGCVRAMMVEGIKEVDSRTLVDHVLYVILSGISKKEGAA